MDDHVRILLTLGLVLVLASLDLGWALGWWL